MHRYVRKMLKVKNNLFVVKPDIAIQTQTLYQRNYAVKRETALIKFTQTLAELYWLRLYLFGVGT